METVIIILLLLGPGLAVMQCLELKAKREKKQKVKATVYEQLFAACVLSIFSTGIAFAGINIVRSCRGQESIATVSGMMEHLNSFGFLICFLIFMILATTIVGIAYVGALKLFLRNQSKNIEKEFNLTPLGDDNPTVWEDMFFDPDKNKEPRIVSIFKDGKYITSGYIDGWNIGEYERKEFEIRRSTEIEELLLRGENSPLNYINEEYFDMETGVLIKFWESEAVNEHWDEL